MYVFPGIGLGAILSKSVNVTQDMIYASGLYLSEARNEEEKSLGLLYPDVTRIREVSVVVTRGVIRAAQANGVDRELSLRHLDDAQLDEYIKDRMYDPFNELKSLSEEIKDISAFHATAEANSASKPAEAAHL
jgi:malate dehydrogenase (oxaloacetate-decarboxylating)(NADP+)